LISLHPEVTVTVIANVARSVDEAKIQSETGRALLSQAEEEALADVAAQEAEADAQEAEAIADEAILEQADAMFDEGAAMEPTEEDSEATAAEPKSDA